MWRPYHDRSHKHRVFLDKALAFAGCRQKAVEIYGWFTEGFETKRITNPIKNKTANAPVITTSL